MALSYSVDTDRPTQIGLIALQSDETIERDFRLMMPPDVEVLVTRVPSSTTVSLETLRAMEESLTKSAALLPRGAHCAAVGYGCTSASAAIGAGRVSEQIRKGVSTPHVTDPLTALIAACNALDVRRIGLVSPYVASVSDQLISALDQAGVSVVSFGSFDEPSEERVVRISRESVRDAALHVGRNGACDAVFLSCTNLRSLEIVDEVEAALGIPVLGSNQVLAWHLGKLAGCLNGFSGIGRLFLSGADLQP